MKIPLLLLFFLFLASPGLVFSQNCQEFTINPRPGRGGMRTRLDRVLRDIAENSDAECNNVTINEGSYVVIQG